MVNRTNRLSKNLTDIFGSNGGSECRVCKNPLGNRHPMRKYCSDKCQRIAYAVIPLFRWENVRAGVLDRDNYACVNPECDATAADDDTTLHVDHVRPLAVDGAALDPANLQTLCDECHRQKGTTQRDYRPGTDAPETTLDITIETDSHFTTIMTDTDPDDTDDSTARAHDALSGGAAVDPADVDVTNVDIRTENGKVLASVDDLQPWDENPRKVDDNDTERLKHQLESLGQYKPLLVAVNTESVPDGTVIGGNMRLGAVEELGWDEVWVSLLSPESEDDLVDYALSDNDRIGYYDEDQMADVLTENDVDVTKFKVDFYKPTDLAQNMATAMDPEELINRSTSTSDPDADDTDTDGDGEATGDGASDGDSDPPSRNIENLGNRDSTSMVQLVMAQSEKDTFGARVDTLKKEYSLETTSEVVLEAVRREYDRIATEYGEEPSVQSSTLADQLGDADADD